MTKHKHWMVALVLAGLVNSAEAQPQRNASRAELLYTTHCIACHDADIHWRDKKLAKGWGSLKSEVARWQAVAGLGWGEDDITAVARYLNGLYYHYPERVRKTRPAEHAAHALGSPGNALPGPGPSR